MHKKIFIFILFLFYPLISSSQDHAQQSFNAVEIKDFQNGHFFANVEINYRPIRMMVDTGASLVVISRNEAQNIGIYLNHYDFKHTAQTPNGPVKYARVVVDNIRIGEITIKDVEMGIIDRSDAPSLLGMSFFNRLKGFQIENGKMILNP